MLDKGIWKDAAPQVSNKFHVRFEQTLEGLESKKIKKLHRFRFKIMIVAAAICVLASGSVLAAEIFGWNHWILEYLQPSQKQQQELPENGMIQDVGQTVTQDGVSITLTQVLHDKNSLYMLCEVQLSEIPENKDDIIFSNGTGTILLDGQHIENLGMTMGEAQFIEDENFADTNTLAYEIRYASDSLSDWEGKNISLTLDSLITYDIKKDIKGEIIAEGPWTFEYPMENSKDLTQTYEINEIYDFDGYEILIHRIEISPLSYTLYADYASAVKVGEDERNTIEYNGDDPGLELSDRINISKIVYDDGAVLIQDDFVGGGGCYPDEDNKMYIIKTAFTKIIDVEHIQDIYLMQGKVKISVK